MNYIRQRVIVLSLAFIFLFSIASCASNSTTEAQLSDQQVTQILTDMLNAYNKADYPTFSARLTPAIKLVITKEAFQIFCTDSAGTLGKFQSVTGVTQVESSDTSSTWAVTAKFDNSTEKFNVTFDKTSGLIEGIDFGPKG